MRVAAVLFFVGVMSWSACGKDTSELEARAKAAMDELRPRFEAAAATLKDQLDKLEGFPAMAPGMDEVKAALLEKKTKLESMIATLAELPTLSGDEAKLSALVELAQTEAPGFLAAAEQLTEASKVKVDDAVARAQDAILSLPVNKIERKAGQRLDIALADLDKLLVSARAKGASAAEVTSAMEASRAAAAAIRAEIDGFKAKLATTDDGVARDAMYKDLLARTEAAAVTLEADIMKLADQLSALPASVP